MYMYTHVPMWLLFHPNSVLLGKTQSSMRKQFGCQKWRNVTDIQCPEWIKTTHASIHILQDTEEPPPGNKTTTTINFSQAMAGTPQAAFWDTFVLCCLMNTT